MILWIAPLAEVELTSMYAPEVVAYAVGVQMRTPGLAAALQSAKADTKLADNRRTNAQKRRLMGALMTQIYVRACTQDECISNASGIQCRCCFFACGLAAQGQ